jgi:hypothetical protein
MIDKNWKEGRAEICGKLEKITCVDTIGGLVDKTWLRVKDTQNGEIYTFPFYGPVPQEYVGLDVRFTHQVTNKKFPFNKSHKQNLFAGSLIIVEGEEENNNLIYDITPGIKNLKVTDHIRTKYNSVLLPNIVIERIKK